MATLYKTVRQRAIAAWPLVTATAGFKCLLHWCQMLWISNTLPGGLSIIILLKWCDCRTTRIISVPLLYVTAHQCYDTAWVLNNTPSADVVAELEHRCSGVVDEPKPMAQTGTTDVAAAAGEKDKYQPDDPSPAIFAPCFSDSDEQDSEDRWAPTSSIGKSDMLTSALSWLPESTQPPDWLILLLKSQVLYVALAARSSVIAARMAAVFCREWKQKTTLLNKHVLIESHTGLHVIFSIILYI